MTETAIKLESQTEQCECPPQQSQSHSSFLTLFILYVHILFKHSTLTESTRLTANPTGKIKTKMLKSDIG